ncbi:MAG: hypothetical protein Q9216_005213 [Gyalolechia sp. 2 TL-2023]
MEFSPRHTDVISTLQTATEGQQSLADRLETIVQHETVDNQLSLICNSFTRLAERADFDTALSWELWQSAIRHEVWRVQYTSLEEFKEEYDYEKAFKHVLSSQGLSRAQRDIYKSLYTEWNLLPDDLLPSTLKPPSWSNNLLSYISQLSRKNVPYVRCMKLLHNAVTARCTDLSSDHSPVGKGRRPKRNGKTNASYLIISDVKAVIQQLKALEDENASQGEASQGEGEGEDEGEGGCEVESTHTGSKRSRPAHSEVDLGQLASMRDRTPEVGRSTYRRLSDELGFSMMDLEDSPESQPPAHKKMKKTRSLSFCSGSDKPEESLMPGSLFAGSSIPKSPVPESPLPESSMLESFRAESPLLGSLIAESSAISPVQNTPSVVSAQHESDTLRLTPKPGPIESDAMAVEVSIESHLPTTDVEGALESLRPGKWLSATAIELILSICSVHGIRVFHGFSLSQPSPPCRPRKSEVILLPIHHAGHWILAKVDMESRAITVYDFFSDAWVLIAKQAILHFVAALDHEKADWSFVAIHNPAQENVYDCGILLLITALHLLIPLPLPSSYHCDTWRKIFTIMLGGSHEGAADRTLLEGVEYQGSDTHPIASIGDLVRVKTQQVVNDISQLEETGQALQRKLDNIRTRISAHESAGHVLECLSQRITALLQSLSQDRDVVERDLALLKEIISRYTEVRTYRNDLVSTEIQKNQGEAAHGLRSKRQRIGGVEVNIKILEKVKSFVDGTRGEDQAMLESLVQDAKAGFEVIHKEQSRLLDKLENLLSGEILKV